MNQRLDQARLGLGQTLAICGVNSDIAESSCAVVLDIDVWGRKKMDENWNGSSVDELLPVIIWRLD